MPKISSDLLMESSRLINVESLYPCPIYYARATVHTIMALKRICMFKEVGLLAPDISKVGLPILGIDKIGGIGGLICILYWSSLPLPSQAECSDMGNSSFSLVYVLRF